MKYHALNVTTNRPKKRVGRGIAAGQGKTAGRGTKGQKSRTGASKRPGFEGGQNPLMQRLPKLRGFKSHQAPADNVFTRQLEAFSGTVTNQTLAEAGLVASPYSTVKLLVKGELKKKLNVKLQAASLAAVKAVEKAGGSFTKVARVGRLKKVPGPKAAK